jgi:hypothetical protein
MSTAFEGETKLKFLRVGMFQAEEVRGMEKGIMV